MEQVNNGPAFAMLQAVASQSQQPPKTGRSDGDSDFQKLMDKAASSTGRDAKTEDAGKTETPAASKTEEAPVEKEDALEQVKKMAEQGYAVVQPSVVTIPFDPNNVTLGQSETGEYVVMQLGEDGEVLSAIELDPWQQQQLQQFMHNMELMDQVKDPKADAVLEATDPNADHSPADLLEMAVDEQAGKVIERTVEEALPQERAPEQAEIQPQPLSQIQPQIQVKDQPQAQVQVQVQDQEQESGDELEIIDVDQAPQQLFHDVKAAPVKVGEVYDAPETEQPDVVRQIDTGLAQALEKGESMVRIQLSPENLGSVTIEISQSAEGIIRVALNAHSGETRGLLERHAGELQGMIANRTQQSVEVDVQRQSESQQGQNQQQNYDGRNGHAQDGQERRRHRQEQAGSQDFIQQMRLGLISADGDEA